MDDYKYSPLDVQTSGFRLLKLQRGSDTISIECEIFHAVISDRAVVPYEALSYTWGNNELVDSINVDGRRLWITENLTSALQCLRYHDQDRILWIDAICINQRDKEEQSQQVLRMGEIFGSAIRVIFWLGKPTFEAALFMDSLGELQTYIAALSEKGTTADSTICKEFWSSIQQNKKSQDCDKSAQWLKGLETLLGRPWFSPGKHVQSVLDLMPGSIRVEAQNSRRRDNLINLLLKFGGSKATDKRDMIYALLGMSSDPFDHQLLRPNYTKPIHEITHNTIRYWFEATDATVPQVIHCLASIKAICTTYIVLPDEVTTTVREMVRLPSDIEGVPLTRDASFFLVEQLSEGIAAEQGKSYTEIDQLQSVLNTREGQKYKDIVHIVPSQSSRHNMKLLVVYHFENALRLVTLLKCWQVFRFILNKICKNKQKLLDSLLIWAVHNDSWDARGLLLEEGAKGSDSSGLAVEAFQGNIKLIQLLIDVGADVNARGGDHGNVLGAAVTNNDFETAQLLIDRGADVNAQEGGYRNALGAAAMNNNFKIAQLLIDRGADVNARGDFFGNAIWTAAMNDHFEIAQLLIDRGADVNAEILKYGNALHAAAMNNHFEIVQLLIDRGADVNAQGGIYGNALCAAAKNDHFEIAQLLVNRGADVNAQGGSYGNALHAAATNNHFEIVQLLIDRGADVNAQGGIYGNALQVAASFDRVEVAQLLIEQGANIDTIKERHGSFLRSLERRRCRR